MYDKSQERAKVLSIVQSFREYDIKFTKQQNFERAVQLSLDELEEFNQAFDRFIQDVSHLEVFQHSLKDQLIQDKERLAKGVSYLISKNYSKAEKENMPHDVLVQVESTQRRRFDLLKRVAVRYLSRPTNG